MQDPIAALMGAVADISATGHSDDNQELFVQAFEQAVAQRVKHYKDIINKRQEEQM